MSSRQLRKLQKQRELEEAKITSEPGEGSGSDEDGNDEGENDGIGVKPQAARPRVSLFAALGNQDDDDDDDEQEGDEDETPKQEHSQVAQDEPAESTPAKKSKSKKKKKKKAKAASQSTSVAAEAGVKDDADEDDEIDRAIRELKLTTAGKNAEGAPTDTGYASQSKLNKLLSINTTHLKAINEMRNLFGRDVIESANAEEEQEQQNRRRRGGAAQRQQVDLETFLRGPPGMKRLPEVSLRRNVFIQGREHWPRATAGGLNMKTLEKAPDGSYTEYAYTHDGEYDAMQSVFFAYVGMGDPMRIVYLLQQVPYHVSTLLQVSMVAKQDQNMALSSELCERALFTFGRVATSAFRQDLENGRARLDFRRPENRQLWLCGYHYLKSLIRKGTYRTALEWSKVLFALDHHDPYSMRHYIHFLAIRAYESQWLIDFIEELEATGDNRDTIYLRQSIILAKLQLKDTAGAKAELLKGMQTLPWLYCALFQELGMDAPPSIWGINAETDSRAFWTKLYIHQMKDLWNNTGAMSLLQQVARGMDKVDKASLMTHDDPPPDLGTTRLVYLEGEGSLITLAPREFLDRQPNYEFDPLPPAKEDNIFSGEGCRLPWDDQSRGSRAMEHQIEQQLRNLMQRQQNMRGAQGAAVGAPGAFGGFADQDDDEDDGFPQHEAEAFGWEEGEADVAERVRDAAQRDGGMLEGLLQRLLGGRGGPGANEAGDEARDEARDDGPLPGAWPEDDEEERRR